MAAGGFGEAIAALVAALAAAAPLDAVSSAPDPNIITQPAMDAGEFAADQCLPAPDLHDGEMAQCIDPSLDPATSSAPVTGDRPKLSPGAHKPDIELEMIIVGNPPAADAPQQSLPPGDDPADAGPPPPAQPPPAGEAESPAGDETPPSSPSNVTTFGFTWPVLADTADQWQFVSSTMPPELGGAPFGITGEEMNAAAKAKVAEVLNKFVADLSAADPEGQWSDPALEATIVSTLATLGIDIATVVVDPPFLVRGIMRLGSGSAEGVEKVEQGDALLGSVQVVGEVSSAVLIVLAPVEAGPRTASMTMYGPDSLISPKGVVHNVVKVKGARREMASDAVKADGNVAMAKEYALDTLKENFERYTTETRSITESRATAVFAEMDRAHAGSYKGVPGGIGRYGEFYNHCSTYAATLSTTGGIPITGIFGPRITLLLFKYAPNLANPTIPLITGGGTANNSAASNGAP